jgi:hypothetical protein
MNLILAPIIVLILVFIGCLIGYLSFSHTRFKKQEIIYLIISLILFTGTGILSTLITSLKGETLFLLAQTGFFLFGTVHLILLYRIFSWARRDQVHKDRDSFLPEFLFTLLIMSSGGIGFLLHFWYWVPEYSGFFSYTLPLFLVPFIFVKTIDAALQVPQPDYELKWRFPAGILDDRSLKWENAQKIFFHTAINIKEDRKPVTRRCKMWVEPSRDESLANAFRLGVREYNIDAGATSIRELGFEPGTPSLWWMFYLKPVLWRPRTWMGQKVLDASVSLARNKLKEGDIVVARRILDDKVEHK